MENIQGKHFSITDKKNVSTVIYQINETSKNDIAKGAPKFTVERLEFSEQLTDTASRKTFFVDNPKPQGNHLVFLSFTDNKVVVNTGVLQDDKIKLSRKPVPVKFDTIFSDTDAVYKEFKCTPNMQRPITIIDPTTTEEVKPTIFLDNETNEFKGKIKLQPQKHYLAFEIREDKK